MEKISDIQKLIHPDNLARQCAYCKKYRLPNGEWIEMPKNTEKKLVGKISHGICPECMEEQLKSIASSKLVDKFANKNKMLNYVNDNLGRIKFIKLPLKAPWDSKDIRQWIRAFTNIGWDEISDIPYDKLLIIASNLWEQYQNIKLEFNVQAKKNKNWYKIAANCQKFNKYKIENLSDEQIKRILNINSLEGAKWLFQIEGSISDDEVDEARKCLLKIWHPDVNSDNLKLAHELTNIIGKCNVILNKAIGDIDFKKEYDAEEVSTRPEATQFGTFEKVYSGLFNREEFDYSRLGKKYVDLSNIPANLINQSGEHNLSIDFSTGNSIAIEWNSEYGGSMSADGNFHPSDERFFKNFYKQPMSNTADYVANILIQLIMAGIDIIGFSGSSRLYKMVKNNLESRAKEILRKNSSMGDVNWDNVSYELDNMGLSQLQNIANEYHDEIMGIFIEYRNKYGDRLSNRKIPWAKDYENTELDRTYPIIRTLKNIPALIKRLSSSEFTTEKRIKESLYNSLRRQIERSKRIYPVDNKNNQTYKIVESFYNKIDAILKDLMGFFG